MGFINKARNSSSSDVGLSRNPGPEAKASLHCVFHGRTKELKGVKTKSDDGTISWRSRGMSQQ
ncbi:uncharacterized protein G2W53_007055 [Senna tora]|uniref:Uncharacterized protein n=1 Tax=Senna tora TaxID=362788 RepID=A0A834X6Y1_9FABA|nr:uncharacterized protein G2W53_007055 [Senna tora]